MQKAATSNGAHARRRAGRYAKVAALTLSQRARRLALFPPPPILRVANSCRRNRFPPCYNRGMILSQENCRVSVSPSLPVSLSPCLRRKLTTNGWKDQRPEIGNSPLALTNYHAKLRLSALLAFDRHQYGRHNGGDDADGVDRRGSSPVELVGQLCGHTSEMTTVTTGAPAFVNGETMMALP